MPGVSNKPTTTRQTAWERDVVRRLRLGDREALGDLVDQFSSTVYGVALYVTGDTATAAEVTVSVFHDAWRRPHHLSVEPVRGSLRTLLAGRARQTALTSRSAEGGSRENRRRIGSVPVDHAAMPDERESRYAETMRARTQACLSCLSPEDQRLLHDVAINGYSIDQAAARSPMPLETMARRLTTALRQLRTLDAPGSSPRHGSAG